MFLSFLSRTLSQTQFGSALIIRNMFVAVKLCISVPNTGCPSLNNFIKGITSHTSAATLASWAEKSVAIKE